MAWIILSSLLVVILVIAVGISVIGGIAEKKIGEGIALSSIIFVVFILLFSALTLLCSVRSVGAGKVGLLKSSSGAYAGQVGEGWHFIKPWNKIEVVSVQNRTFVAASNCHDNQWKNCLDAFTKDNNDVFIVATMNYHIDPENVQTLYRTYPDFEHNIIDSRFAQVVKDETVKYKAEDIAPNREVIRTNVKAKLIAELARYSISADDFFMPNIEFRDDLKMAFEAKAKADQTAQEQQRLVAAETAKAQQKAEAAKGDADALRNTAQGQADANLLISQSLTPALIQFQMIQKLSDKVQVIFLPSGGNSLLDISKLITP